MYTHSEVPTGIPTQPSWHTPRGLGQQGSGHCRGVCCCGDQWIDILFPQNCAFLCPISIGINPYPISSATPELSCGSLDWKDRYF